jgi:tryptophan-rich sensory protein
MTKKRGINWKILIASLAIVFLVALIGSIFAYNTAKSRWYDAVKPDITPSNYILSIVWGILFFLIALSLYFNWIKADKEQKNSIILVYGTNFFLNILWSVLFFGMKNPLIALFDIITLVGSAFVMIQVSYNIDKKAAYLLIPYCLWMGLAAILNLLTVI